MRRGMLLIPIAKRNYLGHHTFLRRWKIHRRSRSQLSRAATSKPSVSTPKQWTRLAVAGWETTQNWPRLGWLHTGTANFPPMLRRGRNSARMPPNQQRTTIHWYCQLYRDRRKQPDPRRIAWSHQVRYSKWKWSSENCSTAVGEKRDRIGSNRMWTLIHRSYTRNWWRKSEGGIILNQR